MLHRGLGVAPESWRARSLPRLEDLSFVSAQVFEVWQLLLATLRRFPALALMHLRAAWDKQLRLHWSESVFSTVLPTGTIMTPEDQKAVARRGSLSHGGVGRRMFAASRTRGRPAREWLGARGHQNPCGQESCLA